MATIDETAAEIASALIDEIGPHESEETKNREYQIALIAATRMSNRLGKSIDIDVFLERTIEFQSKAVSLAEGHIQVIILAGYAAFFALWSSMSPQIPIWSMLFSGSLMTVSLIFFIGWTVAGLILAKFSTERTAKAYLAGPVDFWSRYQEAEKQNLISRSQLMKWWPVIVALAGSTALLSTGVLALFSALAFVNQTTKRQTDCINIVPKVTAAAPSSQLDQDLDPSKEKLTPP